QMAGWLRREMKMAPGATGGLPPVKPQKTNLTIQAAPGQLPLGANLSPANNFTPQESRQPLASLDRPGEGDRDPANPKFARVIHGGGVVYTGGEFLSLARGCHSTPLTLLWR